MQRVTFSKPEEGETLFRPVRVIRRNEVAEKRIQPVDWLKDGKNPMTRSTYNANLGMWILGNPKGLVVFAETDVPDEWTHVTVTAARPNSVRVRFEEPNEDLLLSMYPGPQYDTLGLMQLRRLASQYPSEIGKILTTDMLREMVSNVRMCDIVSQVLDARGAHATESQNALAEIINAITVVGSYAQTIGLQITGGECSIPREHWYKVTTKINNLRSDIMGLVKQ